MLIKETEMGLEGQVAIVTGASRKIGRKIAEAFVNEKMRVAIVSAHADTARAAQQEIGGDTIAIACDISQESDVKEMVRKTVEAVGEINVLVNNAAITIRKPLLELSGQEFNRVISVNLYGTFLCTKYVVERMVEQGKGGRIVNIIASSVFRSRAKFVAYAASKAGVWNMTRQLALELAPHNIRVNALAPGYVETDLNREYLQTENGKKQIKRIPQRRPARMEELSGPLLLLASDASSYMTGAVLAVDGGHLVSSL